MTGKPPFRGKATSDVLAAVMREEPDLSQVPAKLRPLLNRCLEKDPQRRLRPLNSLSPQPHSPLAFGGTWSA